MCIIRGMARQGILGLIFGQTWAGWNELWESGQFEELVVGAALLAVLLAIAWYVIARIRSQAAQQELTATELMVKLREARDQGRLSDGEFRTIKTAMTEKLQAELNVKDRTD